MEQPVLPTSMRSASRIQSIQLTHGTSIFIQLVEYNCPTRNMTTFQSQLSNVCTQCMCSMHVPNACTQCMPSKNRACEIQTRNLQLGTSGANRFNRIHIRSLRQIFVHHGQVFPCTILNSRHPAGQQRACDSRIGNSTFNHMHNTAFNHRRCKTPTHREFQNSPNE